MFWFLLCANNHTSMTNGIMPFCRLWSTQSFQIDLFQKGHHRRVGTVLEKLVKLGVNTQILFIKKGKVLTGTEMHEKLRSVLDLDWYRSIKTMVERKTERWAFRVDYWGKPGCRNQLTLIDLGQEKIYHSQEST